MILTLTLTRVQMWTMVILGREQMSGGQIFGVQMSGYDNNNNNNDNDNTASNSSSSFVRDYLSTAAPIRSRDRHTSVTTSCLATLIFNYRLNNAVRFFSCATNEIIDFRYVPATRNPQVLLTGWTINDRTISCCN